MLRTLLLSLLLVGFVGCNDKKSKRTSEKQATLDLSSAEATGATILTALKSGDKEMFRKCLSPRLQKKAKECEGQETENCKNRHSLDAMFNTVKKGVEAQSMTAKDFKKINGQWHLERMEMRNEQANSRTEIIFDLK